MKHLLSFLIVILLLFCGAKITFCANKAKSELNFVENKGQWKRNILFMSQLKNGAIFIENNAITFALNNRSILSSHGEEINNKDYEKKDLIVQNHAFRLQLIGANKTSKIQRQEQSLDYNNYYYGNDARQWVCMAWGYKTIIQKEVYPSIDWAISSNDDNLKYDFILHPSAKASDIGIKYEGIDKLEIKDSNLVLYTSLGQMVEVKPLAYQIFNGQKEYISVAFTLKGKTISFTLASYDKTKDLVIDPELIFSTYTGSYSDNWGFSATFDKEGNAYLGGISSGTQYPTTLGAYQTSFAGGNWDVVISKFNSTGEHLLFSTYIGDTSCEMPHSLMVNEFNELIVFGTTGSARFPTTPGAYQSTFRGGELITYDGTITFYNGCDIFVSKFNSSGTQLLGSTFVGGSNNDGINYRQRYNTPSSIIYYGNDSLYSNYGDGARGELAIDDNNNIYVGSCTFSSDFPTTQNAFQRTSGGNQDGVIFKLDNSLKQMIFSSYFGGSEDDAIFSIDIDKLYRPYVAGGTVSHNFPITNGCFSPYFNGGTTDGFLALIAYDGTQLISSTYFGSNKKDVIDFVRTDNNGFPYIFGQTYANSNTLIFNAGFSEPNSGQVITKFSPSLDTIIFSTVFGSGLGRPNISPSAFDIDFCGRIYACGWGSFGSLTTHNMTTTTSAFQPSTDNADFYILSLNENATSRNYATFFGEMGVTDHVDGGTSKVDRFGSIYQAVCASCNRHNSFPIYPSTAYSTTNNSQNCNAAIVKFNVHSDFAVSSFSFTPIICRQDTVHFVNNSRGNSFLWSFGNGQTSTDTNPIVIFPSSGIYTIKLIATIDGSCNTSDTSTATLIVLGSDAINLDTLYTCPHIPIQIGFRPIEQTGVSFTWFPSTYLSDSHVTNPYATISSPTRFHLIINTPNCSDTIYQFVNISYFDLGLTDTVTFCSSPYNFTIDSTPNSHYFYSLSRDFSSIINSDTLSPTLTISFMESKYVYVKVWRNDCFAIDSIWFNFTGTKVTLSTTNVLCYGASNGSASANTWGGTGQKRYYWSCSPSNQSSINSIAEGSYFLIITDSLGCQTRADFTISSAPEFNYTLWHSNNNCLNVCSARVELSCSGATPPYIYHWSNGQTSANINSLCSGTYLVNITDSNNCHWQDTIIVIQQDLFSNFFAHGSPTIVDRGDQVTLTSKNIAQMFYFWSGDATLTTPNSYTTTAYPKQSTTYWVIVFDSLGCSAKDSVRIIVDTTICGKGNIFVANVFTPNSDGKDDILKVEGDGIETLFFTIFDRWGEQVFSSNKQSEGWDGTFRGNKCTPGVYFYRLEVGCSQGKSYKTAGDVTLIR
jgi:FOG: PKD repeat